MPGLRYAAAPHPHAAHLLAASNGAADPYLPMLHVRRDLHHKTLNLSKAPPPPSPTQAAAGQPANSLVEPARPPSQPLHSPHEAMPSFLGSIPVRKRILPPPPPPPPPPLVELVVDHHQRSFLESQSLYALNMSRHPPRQLLCKPPPPPPPSSSSSSSSSTPSSSEKEANAAAPQPAAAPAAPRRTGFSIEDIMRR
ncbi:hypothetical protein KR093_007050 [Drosophila rubida]|uniref:Uncharacterized protein n=1 Tax=Drosophila rubida TaxID=30044 RepID=A0AAD4PP15_9MUSC|nr:hypothetical protein KR093_007050 [Drosophila rubida]